MQEYHARAKTGIKLLLGRQVWTQVITFLAGIVIARTLNPAEVGLYIVSLSLVAIFGMFADFGLAPSFIQRKAELTDLDLQVGFTLQQILTSLLVVVLLLVGGAVAQLIYPDLPEVIWLLRVLSFNLYLTSWRSMSALQLERHLKYDRLANIEVVETLAYHGTTVILALCGMGVWSFIIGVLVQGCLGAVLMYLASPWPIRFRLDWQVSWQLLRYGIPFQFQSLMNSFGSWVTTIVVGRFVGASAIGYLTWASSNGRKPLLLTGSVMRVAFPHFSRIQDNLPEVERIVVRYLSGMLLIAGLWFTGIAVTCPGAVELVYTAKWVPAVPALIMYSGGLALDMMSWIVGVTLNSVGRIKFSTAMVTTRMALNLILTLLFIYLMRHGEAYNGVAIAYLVSSALVVPLMLRGLGRGVMTRILRQLAWIAVPVSLGVAGGLAASWATRFLPLVVQVASAGLVATALFALAAWFAAPAWARGMVQQRLGRFRRPPADAPAPAAPPEAKA
jgi:O-antigen/teichoic acid export membrane protein